MSRRALSGQYSSAGLHVYVAGDGADIYEDHFLQVATGRDGVFTPTLILIGIRLGIERVTPSYWPSLKESLKFPQSVGIAGLVIP
jgi:cysteine protease ATG4